MAGLGAPHLRFSLLWLPAPGQLLKPQDIGVSGTELGLLERIRPQDVVPLSSLRRPSLRTAPSLPGTRNVESRSLRYRAAGPGGPTQGPEALPTLAHDRKPHGAAPHLHLVKSAAWPAAAGNPAAAGPVELAAGVDPLQHPLSGHRSELAGQPGQAGSGQRRRRGGLAAIALRSDTLQFLELCGAGCDFSTFGIP